MTDKVETTSSAPRDGVTALVLVGVHLSQLRRDRDQRGVKR
jgi:hypothetical protein